VSGSEQNVVDAIQKLLGKYAIIFAVTIVSISFAAGCWATNIENKIAQLGDGQKKMLQAQSAQIAATNDRIKHWTEWRDVVNDKIKTMGNRFTSIDFDIAVTMFNRQGPPVLFPYFYEIKREEN